MRPPVRRLARMRYETEVTTWEWAVLVVTIASLLGWAWRVVLARRHAPGMPVLAREPLPEPTSYPRLSVVLAACNEEQSIEACVRSLLRQDHPDFEVVVVDDRSTDGTGRILDSLAERTPGLVVVHNQRLPPGWLGKVHALDLGLQRARGEWVLFTDGDVVFEERALTRAAAYCADRGVDHLTLMPENRAPGFRPLLEATSLSFGLWLLLALRPREVNAGRAGRYAGIGAFNFFRRATYDRTEGLGWLRLEVLDDIGLGLLLARHGARSAILDGCGTIHLCWYPSLGRMVSGLEKNLFGGVGHYRLARVLLEVSWILWTNAVPFAGAALLGRSWIWITVLTTHVVGPFAMTLALRLKGSASARLLPMAIIVAGNLLLAYAMLRSAVKCLRAGGATWRGTHYPLAELRAGQRVRLGARSGADA
jgi:glycosyltransferase involved in cell wall biosynthesis